MWQQRQRSEWGNCKPRNAKDLWQTIRSQKEANSYSPTSVTGSVAPLTPWLWNSSLQNWETIKFCCLKSKKKKERKREIKKKIQRTIVIIIIFLQMRAKQHPSGPSELTNIYPKNRAVSWASPFTFFNKAYVPDPDPEQERFPLVICSPWGFLHNLVLQLFLYFSYRFIFMVSASELCCIYLEC